ncbi:hypothetical protein ACEQPO_13790 [Bacillus sp. SL00103]
MFITIQQLVMNPGAFKKRAIQVAQERSNLLSSQVVLNRRAMINKETIASTLRKELVLNEEAFESIQEYFRKDWTRHVTE